MFEFAMAHEIICLIVVLSLIWASERAFTAFVNRNKPDVDCERDCECDCDDEGEEEPEVIAMGGEEEDDS